jgi:hypothetical protein
MSTRSIEELAEYGSENLNAKRNRARAKNKSVTWMVGPWSTVPHLKTRFALLICFTALKFVLKAKGVENYYRMTASKDVFF